LHCLSLHWILLAQHSEVADAISFRSLHLLQAGFTPRRFDLGGEPALQHCFAGCIALQDCITSKHFAAARNGCVVSSGFNFPLFLRGLKQ
jgi:hypothetical protein